jgi:hypothetical protein
MHPETEACLGFACLSDGTEKTRESSAAGAARRGAGSNLRFFSLSWQIGNLPHTPLSGLVKVCAVCV